MTGREGRRTGRGQEDPRGRWMLTFNDLMTLLLAFFILVLAFSALRPEKASRAAASAVSALGASRLGGNLAEQVFSPVVRPYRDRDIEAEKARRGGAKPAGNLPDRQASMDAVAADVPGARVAAAAGGFILRLEREGLFDGDSLRRGAPALAVLDRLAAVARGGAGVVSVSSPGASGETKAAGADREGAFLRSDRVARYLNETGGVPAERIVVSWAGAAGGGAGREPGPAAAEIRLEVRFAQ